MAPNAPDTIDLDLAVKGLAVLTAIPVVLLALWADYFGRYVEELALEKPDFDRAAELSRVRMAAICGILLQLTIYMGTTDIRSSFPVFGTLLFLGSIFVQSMIQGGLERKVRGGATQFRFRGVKGQDLGLVPGSRPAPGPMESYRDRERARDGEAPAHDPAMIATRAFFWCAAGGALYVAVLLSSVKIFALIAQALHTSQATTTLLVILGGAIGVLGGLGINFALGPVHLRKMFPVSRLAAQAAERPEEKEIETLFETCFSRAGLKPYSFWVIEFERFPEGSTLAAGFRSGRGIFRPGFFISRSALTSLSRDELQALVLNEVSHIQLKHLRKRFFFSAALIIGTTALATTVVFMSHVLNGGSGGLLGPFSGLAAFVITFRALAKQSKAHEREADVHSIARLGANLDHLASALRKLENIGIPEREHRLNPEIETRILALKAVFAADQRAPESKDERRAA